MKRISRRDFLKRSIRTGGIILSAQMIGGRSILAGASEKFDLNVGYLPISDHLILPVSHALDNPKYNGFNVRPYLCRSWDEILGKIDMGIFHAAFMLAPLAMYEVSAGSPLRCVLLGHTNGSVIASEKSITDAAGLLGKTVSIPHSKSTHRVLLYKYLKDNGIRDYNRVKLMKVSPPLTVKTLKAGRIDAYAVAEPWGIRGVDEGVARTLELSKDIIPGHVCCLVMINKRIIEKKPDVVSAWVNSLQNAGQFIHDDPDRACLLQKPYMKHLPEEMAKTVRDDIISYRHLSPSRKKLGRMNDLAFECGVLSEKCNLDTFINSSFV